MTEVRQIFKDVPLCDGTPRREKGWRVVVEYTFGLTRWGGPKKIYQWSPLLKTRKQAADWCHKAHILKLRGLT